MPEQRKAIYFLDGNNEIIDMVDISVKDGEINTDKIIWGCKIECEDYWHDVVQLSKAIDSKTLWAIAESTGFDFYKDDDLAEMDRLCAVICFDRKSVDLCWSKNEQDVAEILIQKLKEWSEEK